MKAFSTVVRVTWGVKQAGRTAALMAGAGDEAFVGVEVGADVARGKMARMNAKKLVLEKGMFADYGGMNRIVDINCLG